MLIRDLEKELMKLAQDARDLGYTVITPTLFVDPVFGSKLAYYQNGRNKIVMHDDFVENADSQEIELTLIHELAHAVAEQNNTTGKSVWHGEAWKEINAKLGGNSERFHQGNYHKPAHVKQSTKDMYAIKPKFPADRWEQGTFKQWLTRGYHVTKGQHGTLSVWEFSADEYETNTDGETYNWGRAAAVYFSPDQVETN